MTQEFKLPRTEVKTAEERLEELVKANAIRRIDILGQETQVLVPIVESRTYPDGFEGIRNGYDLPFFLYIPSRKTIAYY